MTVVLAAVVAILGLAASPAAADPTPSGGSNSGASADDTTLPKKYAVFVPLKITSADGASLAAALPSGCGLYVTLTRNGNTLHSSVLTQCLVAFQTVRTNADLSRSRWYGWEHVQGKETKNDYSRTAAADMDYDCSGTGTHDFKLVGTGYLIASSGTTYYAQAYDQINGVGCGG